MGRRDRLAKVGSFVKEVDEELARFTCKFCGTIYGVPSLARDCEETHEDEE